MDAQFIPEHNYLAYDQQQTLLTNTGYPYTAPTTANFVEQIETSGARVEEILGRLNCHYQTLFFFAAFNMIIFCILGFFSALCNLEFSSAIGSIFLMIFSSGILILDLPGRPRWASKYRQSIRKHVRFLTRITGKSICLLYLGCMILSCFNPRYTMSPFFAFTVFVLSMFVISVALLGLFIAIRKSMRLERLRCCINESYPNNWSNVYRKYAINDPAHGLQFEEFNRMASDYSQGKLLFDNADLMIIYNALDEHRKNAIDENEFGYWITGGLGENLSTNQCINQLFRMIYL